MNHVSPVGKPRIEVDIAPTTAAAPAKDITNDVKRLFLCRFTRAQTHDQEYGLSFQEIERIKLALMFEWGGGCLWCRNDLAFKALHVGPVENSLSLPSKLLERLHKLSSWHDTALDWAYPPDPGPWSREDYESFDEAAIKLAIDLQNHLGASYKVIYEKLGEFQGQ